MKASQVFLIKTDKATDKNKKELSKKEENQSRVVKKKNYCVTDVQKKDL